MNLECEFENIRLVGFFFFFFYENIKLRINEKLYGVFNTFKYIFHHADSKYGNKNLNFAIFEKKKKKV